MPARRGVPQIEVTFDIDANGIVNVSAKDLGTGKEQHITITAGSNMSDADIEKAVKEAAQFEAEDKKRKEAVDTKNDADSIIFQTEKALNEVGDKIGADDKAKIQGNIDELKKLVENVDPATLTDAQIQDIKAAQEKLMTESQNLFAKMYENAQGAAGAASDMGSGSTADMNGANNESAAANDDNVVDGDFKEV